MNKKQKDRHLDEPAEANRDKHINFIAEERSEIDPAAENVKGPLNEDSINQQEKQQERRRKKSNTA
jgi:hypothetical protein